MAKNNRISMPSSGGGLIRYFEDEESKVEFKPAHVIALGVIIIIIEIILHMYGSAIFGF